MESLIGFFRSRPAWAYFILTMVMLLPGTAALPLVDRDEPRFAQAAREMMERKDWIIPTFNGDYRFDKPPLIYWMMIVCYGLLGPSELAARMPSAVCAFLLALLTHRTAARWFSARAAWLAGIMTLTHLQMVFHGRAAVADMPMVVAVLVAQTTLWERVASPTANTAHGWFWRLYGSLGLGFLAKGPVAVLIPLLTLPVYWLWAGRPPLRLSALRPLAGLALWAAIVGAWGVPALVATGGEFARVGLGHHVVRRGLEAFEGHGAPFFFYLLSAPLSLLPWSRFLPPALRLAREKQPTARFLASWIVVTFALFSLYSTKLPHYVMPCFPAIFILAGAALDKGAPPSTFDRRWALTIGAVGWALTLGSWAGAAAAYAAAPWPAEAALALGGLGCLLAGLMMVPSVVLRRTALAPLAALLVVGGTEMLARGLRGASASLRALQKVGPANQFDARGFIGYREPSLVFYAGRRWETLNDENDLARFAQGAGSRLIILQMAERRFGARPREASASLRTRFDALASEGYTIYRCDGVNFARAAHVELGIAARPRVGPHVE